MRTSLDRQFNERTKPITFTAPADVLSTWNDWGYGTVRSVIGAATLLRWLGLDVEQRAEAVRAMQRQVNMSGPKVKTSFTIPAELVDQARDCKARDFEGSHMPAGTKAVWIAAALHDATQDRARSYFSDGDMVLGNKIGVINAFMVWGDRHEFIAAMEAAGCDMSAHDSYAPVPVEGETLYHIKQAAKATAEDGAPGQRTDPADWWLPEDQRGELPDDYDDRGEAWKP